MKPDGDGFADAVLPADRRARLRGRPSGLKGHYRDRCPTGLRPALDPQPPRPLTAQSARTARRSAHIKIKPLQTKSLRFQGIATGHGDGGLGVG